MTSLFARDLAIRLIPVIGLFAKTANCVDSACFQTSTQLWKKMVIYSMAIIYVLCSVNVTLIIVIHCQSVFSALHTDDPGAAGALNATVFKATEPDNGQ